MRRAYPISISRPDFTQQEIGLFLQACAYLFTTKACIKCCSFKTVTKLFGLKAHTLSAPSELSIPQPLPPVSIAVRRAAKYLPGEYVCLPQAIAGMLMLKSQNQAPLLILGVRTDPSKSLKAHAWLVSQKSILLGGSFKDYESLAAFK